MLLNGISAIIKTVDEHAREMNRRWGFNRLPHIVPIEWTEKFVRQKRKWEMACFEASAMPTVTDLEAVRKHGDAMLRAFDKLDELAVAGGKSPSPPGRWEFELTNGTPIVLVRTQAEMAQVEREPAAQVWCLEEIANIIEKIPEMIAVKQAFPKAELVQVRTSKAARDKLDDALSDIPGFD